MREDNKPNVLWSVFTNKCPRCRQGHLFTDKNPYHLKRTVEMPEHCAVCGQKFELETGFYFGTGFVSYGLTVLFSMLFFVAWWSVLGISIYDNSIFWWLGVNALILLGMQPIFQRWARSIWIAFFVKYERNAAHT